MLKLLIYASGFSAIFLNRFGLPVTNDFSLSFSYIFLYLALAFAFTKGLVKFDFGLLLCFAALLFSGGISFLQGYPDKTLTSFLFFIFIYFPFTFISVTPNSSKAILSVLFYPMLVFLGIAGICQFFFQFLAKPDWLFDYRPFLPLFLQSKAIMNTVIPIGGFIKSNGFFLLEPSGFSQWMALGIFCFGVFAKPFFTFFVFLTGLITSFSGTGIILLFFIIPLSLLLFDASRRYLVIFFVLLFAFGSFLAKDQLLVSRISEFQGGAHLETTSAAARFINPIIPLRENLLKSPQFFLWGTGPGTTFRILRDYESHDPVWAKLFLEYGIVGGILLLLFLFRSVVLSNGSRAVALLFFIQWFFLGGHLLTPDVVAVYVLYYKLPLYE